MKHLRFPFLLVSVGLLVALGIVTGGQEKAKTDAAKADVKKLVEGNNEFALDLYRQLSKQPGNLIFSPYSVSSALALAHAGAKTETAVQMAKTLHFNLDEKRLHPAFAQLIEQMHRNNKYHKLVVANALWGQKGLQFRADFLDLMQEFYDAGFKEVDFAANPEAARETINRWIEEQTDNKIRNLLPALTKDNRLILTNAVYFKGSWVRPFHANATSDDDFWLSAKQKISVPMMRHDLPTSYFENETLKALKLSFGMSEAVFVVPKKIDGLPQLEKQMSGKTVQQWGFTPCEVKVKLPRFQVTSSFGLTGPLVALGMPLPFSAQADFSGISDQEKLTLNSVLHKAYIKVNEEGSEAAAATGVVVVKNFSNGGSPLPIREFYVDRSFIFMIRENSTGTILFIGRVVDPRAN
jgi:serpin B